MANHSVLLFVWFHCPVQFLSGWCLLPSTIWEQWSWSWALMTQPEATKSTWTVVRHIMNYFPFLDWVGAGGGNRLSYCLLLNLSCEISLRRFLTSNQISLSSDCNLWLHMWCGRLLSHSCYVTQHLLSYLTHHRSRKCLAMASSFCSWKSLRGSSQKLVLIRGCIACTYRFVELATHGFSTFLPLQL